MLGSTCAFYFLWFHFPFNSNWIIASTPFKTSALILNKHTKHEWRRTLFHFYSQLVSLHRWHRNGEQKDKHEYACFICLFFNNLPLTIKNHFFFYMQWDDFRIVICSFSHVWLFLWWLWICSHIGSGSWSSYLPFSSQKAEVNDLLCSKPIVGFILTSH